MRTFVVCEAAACHDGDFHKALRLVDLAKNIGADAVKFQWTSAPERLCERRRAPEYRAAYELLAFPERWHAELAEYCAMQGVEYLCTVYLPEDIAVIAPYVRRFKVASFEVQDEAFLAAHDPYRRHPTLGAEPHPLGGTIRPMILSLGLGGAACAEPPWSYRLHCVSAYPCPDEQINLARLRNGFYDGLSDHTLHPWTGGLAVAAGARIIEFHVRLHDTDPANADFCVARDPLKAGQYVANIRQAERMLGSGQPGPMPAEAPMLCYRVAP
mgnify:CR=1 FL=1